MERDKLVELYKKYNLEKTDVFKHQHFVIITRQGIEKIQAQEQILIKFDVIKCENNFAVVKATAAINEKDKNVIQTFGSAYKGATFKEGNTNSWYVMEMAEKRALSRAVLKLTGFYSLGVFGEDESEDFKNNNKTK
jgi:hypothetical protein